MIINRSIGSSSVIATWNADANWRVIKKHLADRLEDAITIYKDQVKNAVRIKGSIDIGSSLVLAISRSSPGQPPYLQTGNLEKSIQADVDRTNLIAYAYTDADYAPTLELGGTFDTLDYPHVNKRPLNRPLGKYIAPRPVWLPVLMQYVNDIIRKIAGY